MDFKTVLTVISMVVAGVAAFFAYQGSNQTELHKLDKRLIELEAANQGEDAIADAVPRGVVVASLKRCVDLGDEWTDFEEGTGRVIVGVGKETIEAFERTFRLDEEGGFYEHVLTEAQMPSHSHGIGNLGISDSNNNLHVTPERVEVSKNYRVLGAAFGRFPAEQNNFGSHNHGLIGGIDETGSNDPHNNMPPYIALYFCKKEG